MAPKRRSSPARASSPPPFDKEFHDVFNLLKSIARSTDEKGGEGKLSAKEFETVKEFLSSVTSSRSVAGSGMAAAKHHRAHESKSTTPNDAINYLSVLSAAEFSSADKSGSGEIGFSAFADWQRQIVNSAARTFTDRKQLLVDGIEGLEGLERRCSIILKLEDAQTASALKQAIKDAVLALGTSDPALASHEERLALLEAPFTLTLSTLSGVQHEVEMTRTQTVGSLRSTAARLFEKKTYRLLLAVSSKRLEPDSESLEACGISMSTEIGVAFAAEDPWREMPIERLLEEAVHLNVCSEKKKEELCEAIANGSLSEEQLVAKYAPQLQAEQDFRVAKEELRELRKMSDERIAELKAMPLENTSSQDTAFMAYSSEIAKRESDIAASEKSAASAVTKLRETKTEAEALLDQAFPALEATHHALNCLTKADISEAQCWTKPPQNVMEIFKAVCILFGISPDASKKSKELESYWDASRKQLLSNCRFLQMCLAYDKDSIDPATIRRLEYFITNDQWLPDNMRKYSAVAAALSRWVHSMHLYHHTAKEVEPLRAVLHNGEREYALILERLEIERTVLQCLREGLQAIHETKSESNT